MIDVFLSGWTLPCRSKNGDCFFSVTRAEPLEESRITFASVNPPLHIEKTYREWLLTFAQMLDSSISAISPAKWSTSHPFVVGKFYLVRGDQKAGTCNVSVEVDEPARIYRSAVDIKTLKGKIHEGFYEILQKYLAKQIGKDISPLNVHVAFAPSVRQYEVQFFYESYNVTVYDETVVPGIPLSLASGLPTPRAYSVFLHSARKNLGFWSLLHDALVSYWGAKDANEVFCDGIEELPESRVRTKWRYRDISEATIQISRDHDYFELRPYHFSHGNKQYEFDNLFHFYFGLRAVRQGMSVEKVAAVKPTVNDSDKDLISEEET